MKASVRPVALSLGDRGIVIPLLIYIYIIYQRSDVNLLPISLKREGWGVDIILPPERRAGGGTDCTSNQNPIHIHNLFTDYHNNSHLLPQIHRLSHSHTSSTEFTHIRRAERGGRYMIYRVNRATLCINISSHIHRIRGATPFVEWSAPPFDSRIT